MTNTSKIARPQHFATIKAGEYNYRALMNFEINEPMPIGPSLGTLADMFLSDEAKNASVAVLVGDQIPQDWEADKAAEYDTYMLRRLASLVYNDLHDFHAEGRNLAEHSPLGKLLMTYHDAIAAGHDAIFAILEG